MDFHSLRMDVLSKQENMAVLKGMVCSDLEILSLQLLTWQALSAALMAACSNAFMASISAFAISSSFIFLIVFSSASWSKYFISASNFAALAAALILLERAKEPDNWEDFVQDKRPEFEDLTGFSFDGVNSAADFQATFIEFAIY